MVDWCFGGLGEFGEREILVFLGPGTIIDFNERQSALEVHSSDTGPLDFRKAGRRRMLTLEMDLTEILDLEYSVEGILSRIFKYFQCS